MGVAAFQFSLVIWDHVGLTLGGTIAGLVVGHLTFAIPFVVGRACRPHPLRFLIEEAAQNLGAGPWRTFFHVTLPVLRPSVASGADLRLPDFAR